MKARIREIIFQIKKFINQLGSSSIDAFSAQAAFFIMIAIFPCAILVLMIIQFLPFSQNELQDIMFSFFPADAGSFVKNILTDIHQNSTGTLISVAAVTTLWSASSGIYSLMKGINSAYLPNHPETRSYIRLKAKSVVYTIFFIVILISTMIVFVFGNSLQLWIEGQFPALTGTADLILSLRTIVGIVILTVFSLTLYLTVPNRKSKVRHELPGALISAVGWVIFSFVFSIYINNFSDYSKFYGSIAAVVLMMLWLYFCMFIMILGAQINIFIQNYNSGSSSGGALTATSE